MAKKNQNTPSDQTSSATTNSFNKGMVKDMSESFMPEGTWYHARNLVNNSSQGDLGVVGNEPSNVSWIKLSYSLIGAIPVIEDYWVLFSTDDVMSEVGLFKEKSRQYYIISRDEQWNFKRSNNIIGATKANFDCSFQVYWADGLNPDRTLNIGDITLGNYPDVLNNEPWLGVPYECTDSIPGPCIDCTPNVPLTLNVERTRISSLMSIPCVTIQKGYSGGQLPNGSYYATVAYSINQQRVTDYFNPSQVQPIFSHENLQGSIDINFSNLDTDNFSEFQLVVVSTINQQTVARIIGYYSTQTNSVSLDNINPELETVPIQYIPLRSGVYEKSEAIYAVNNYLIRTAPTGRFDFNYQPLANQIETEWVMVEYPADYYEKGGNETGYMRDEQYCFWIRWVYNTGERSSSYHIPGRAAQPWETASYGTIDRDNIERFNDPEYDTKLWEVVNTAYATSTSNTLPAENASVVAGNIIARGKMGYWESTETYPADKPNIWNATQYPCANTNNPIHDLCGLPIRHHKMPADFLYSTGDNITDPDPNLNYSHVRIDTSLGNGVAKAVAIRLLGVQFQNIKAPVDNNCNIIPGIVGYEILRSNRQGNRSIVAKGIINNMRSYREDLGTNFPSAEAKEILYPNYVGNYLGPDFTLTEYGGDVRDEKDNPDNFLKTYKSSFFTFHSPDTNFQRPFLSASELKLYGELGHAFNMKGSFEPVPGHPKEKLLTSAAFILGTLIAMGYAAKSIRGEYVRKINGPTPFNAGINGALGVSVPSPQNGSNNFTLFSQGYNTIANLISNVFGEDLAVGGYLLGTTIPSGGGRLGPNQSIDIKSSDFKNLSPLLQIATGIPTFAFYWGSSTSSIMDLIKVIVPYREYALRSTSYIDLSVLKPGNIKLGNTRRSIFDSTYLESQFTVLGNLQVNNLYRPQSVGLQVGIFGLQNPQLTDTSVQTIGSIVANANTQYTKNYGITHDDPSSGYFRTTSSCYYAGLKVRYRNQYGQIDSPKQIPTGCVYRAVIPLFFSAQTSILIRNTPTIFGGDVYIGRYTEKNTFFYFYDWLYNVTDGTEMNYKLKYMINYPRFYADFFNFDTSDLFQGLSSLFEGYESSGNGGFFSQIGDYLNIFNDLTNNSSDGGIIPSLISFLPGSKYNLDTADNSIYDEDVPSGLNFRFGVRDAYMYLFQSGIRDFFVESEYNVDLRDWGELKQERIYDPYGYGDLRQLFDTDIIKLGNYYKYDISLGLSKIYNSYISWGNLQDRSYNPEVAETCFTYFPNRVIYSLPQTKEDKKDYWRVYLVNNYNDFSDRVTAFKSINKNGAIILFENSTPLLFNAVDQLQTVAGTKITIGDGGLFSQPLQTLNNADAQFLHGSCQDRLSVVNTPAGIYWMSAAQGKIFTVADGLMAISDMGMKWWFSKYLKYFLLDRIPDFDLIGNPTLGIACQVVYDNDNGVLYFSKRDFKIKPEYAGGVRYLGDGQISIRGFNLNIKTNIRDLRYFDDVSWTVSFDTKTKSWLSFHDWHPDYVMASSRGFLTYKYTGYDSFIWKHANFTSSTFCRFYGTEYPWEIDYVSSTGQTVNTTRSVEYLLESYIYDRDGIDRFQVLDHNFDEAIVYNTEQTSGVLRLNATPKNNAPMILGFPKVNLSNIDILYSKEEQKIRFNQFWDITNDRGEFFAGTLVQQSIWDTELNGYIRVLNPNNLNYAKPAFQRKKFRHYLNHVVLTKKISGNVKMLLKVINNKLLNSPR
jgi:hypothetical protein